MREDEQPTTEQPEIIEKQENFPDNLKLTIKHMFLKHNNKIFNHEGKSKLAIISPNTNIAVISRNPKLLTNLKKTVKVAKTLKIRIQ